MDNIVQKSYQKLEIEKIIDQLGTYAVLPKTKKMILDLAPSTDMQKLDEALAKVDEALKIIMRSERAPIMMDSDYHEIIKLSQKGAKLSALQIYETVKLFQTVKANIKLLGFLKNEHIDCKYYETLVLQLEIIEYLDHLILKSIDETGYVMDSASPMLKQIRTKLNHIDSRIKGKCQEILAKETDKLSQPSIVMRNDCYCLAVKSEYKNSIRGIVQDYSSSMQTVYIEPEAVGILMREKTILYHQEHDEVEKILCEISKDIESEAERLNMIFDSIVQIDFIFAKAVFAKTYEGNHPKLNHDGNLILVNARHPLLKVKKVIPNHVTFDKNYDGIIITGPNTGGKTVLLKTVGLLIWMTKLGLLIPADENSDVMLYDEVYCDIGDDQSIQNNLSTFSSHMGNIVDIINHVTPSSLVLFDEIGAGTDPIEGSNLAIAILKYLVSHHVSFITTTHYSDLKAFAFEEPRIINASMEFNQTTLSPTYRLLIGVSGSSNALNIASRLGLKKEILEDAKKRTLTNDSEVRKLILKLERLTQEQEHQKLELMKLKKENQDLQQNLQFKLQSFESERNKLLKKSEQEAEEIIEKAKQDSLRLLEDLQQKQSNNLKLHEVIDMKRKINELTPTTVQYCEKKKEEKNAILKLETMSILKVMINMVQSTKN